MLFAKLINYGGGEVQVDFFLLAGTSYLDDANDYK